MSVKCLSSSQVEKIRARRRQGITLATLASEYNVSIGTLHNALKVEDVPAGRKKTRTAAVSAPTAEDLRNDLANLADAIRRDLASSESPAIRASLSRVLVTLTALQAKVTPPPPPDPNLNPDFTALAEEGERKLMKLLKELPE